MNAPLSPRSRLELPAAEAVEGPRVGTYGQILKSSLIIGGSSVVTIAFAIVRNKAMAVLLGPAGIGLMGIYASILELAQTAAGLGVQASGVRQIAEANASGDARRVATTAIVLRRVSLVLGFVGALALIALSVPVAGFTFADTHRWSGVALLSLALFLQLVAAGQTALVHGMRRIADLAAIAVIGAFSATAICIPIVYLFGQRGIVPSIVLMAASTLLASWYYSRKIRIAPVSVPLARMKPEATVLLRLGAVFMATALLTVGAAYAVRMLVLRHYGIEAAGLYQAAWVLGGLYAGFILQAMGTDFYPRLTAAAQDDAECNRLVNEQAEISILLAGPGVLVTLTAAPFVISLFYTSEFHPAAGLLRWICLGMMLRVVAWPMGFMVLAKGKARIMLFTDLAAAIVHVGLAFLLLPILGLAGSAIAFCGLYVWHSVLIYVIVARLTGFRWSSANLRLGAVFIPAVCVAFAGFALSPGWQATALGTALAVSASAYSAHALLRLFPPGVIAHAVRRRL